MNIYNSCFKTAATLIALSCLLISCNDDENLPSAQGQLQLKIQPADLTSSSGRITTEMTPDAIVLTLVGNGTETRKTLDLIDFSGEYTTNPISLSVGNYEVTEFIVTNSDDEVIYAVPRKDSEFGSLVSQPLPISITINSEQVQTLAPQVISVAGKTASEFGYASFGFDVLPSFRITTMGMVDGVAELITPRLVLTQASDTLLDYELKDAINEVPYVDNGVDLRLTLMQHGFARYSQVFSADSLRFFEDEPLLVIVENALTIEMIVTFGDDIPFDFRCDSESTFIIDWGNNIDYDTLQLNGPSFVFPTYPSGYDKNMKHYISVSGDLLNIKSFFNGYNQLNYIDFHHLKNLTWLTLYATSLPQIDISNNLKLEDIIISNNNEAFTKFDLSNHAKLETVEIYDVHLKNVNWSGCESLSFVQMRSCESLEYPFINFESEQFTLNDSMNIDFSLCKLNRDEMDEFIRMIYENLEAKPSYGGSISFLANSTPYSTGIYYIELIEEKYGWTITYSEDPF